MLFKNENNNIQDFFKTNHEINSFNYLTMNFEQQILLKDCLFYLLFNNTYFSEIEFGSIFVVS